MKRSLAFIAAFILLFGACYAEDEIQYECGGLQYMVSESWWSETQEDGTVIFFDESSGYMLSVYSEGNAAQLFDDDFDVAVQFMQGAFHDGSLWSNVGIICTNNVAGCYAGGYIGYTPAAFAYVENDGTANTFVLADITEERNPTYMVEDLLDFLPWMDDSGDVVIATEESTTFSISDMEYDVPAGWRHEFTTYSDDQYHSFNGEDVLLSVTWNESRSITSALELLNKQFPNAMIDILYGDFYGFIADGEMFNGRKAVKAYVVDDDNAGCIEIAYRHDGSESLRAEFDQLFATFRRIAD